MTDRWQSLPIKCQGGLILDTDALTQGTQYPGSARVLENYEPAIEGGYRKINGFTKYDSTAVTGGTNNPILGLKVFNSGVLAVRKNSGGTDNIVYFSTGSGWTAASTTVRGGSPTKARFITYSMTAPVVILTDGVNYAWKYDGTTETTINGTGAPSNPKFAALFKNRLVLSGYSANTSAISLTAPNTDTDFNGAAGALEISVGDVVVGLKTFREELYIFCQRAIKKLVGNTSADFQIVDVVKSLGCLSGDSIQEISGDLLFLSADGFRTVAGTEKIGDIDLGLVSKQIQPIVRSTLSNNFSESVYSSLVIRRKSQYRIFLNDSNSTEADTVGYLGRVTDIPVTERGKVEWAVLRGIKPHCCDSDLTNQQELAVIGHPTSGYVYQLESGNTFDGTNIYAIYRTPDITFEDASIRKVFQKLALYTQVDGNIEFLINLKLDKEQTDILQPDSITVSQTGAVPVYGTAVYGTDTYGAVAYPTFYNNLIGSGFTGAFQFSSSNDKAPHRIDSFQVSYAMKGRR